MASIHQMILNGRLTQLNLLINKIGCNINEKDSFGRTPLHLAVLSNQETYGYRLAYILLYQGHADINVNDYQQQTPFIYACLLNRSKLISLFLQTKLIDWFHIDYQGYFILHHAASSSNISILAQIIYEMKSIGLSMDCKTRLGYTPLILAIKSYQFNNAIYLLEHTNASLFITDDEYHLTCQQWTENVRPTSNEWKYYSHEQQSNIKKNISNYRYFQGNKSSEQCRMFLSNHHHHHIKSLEESIYTPTILSPRSKDQKSLPIIIPIEKSNFKSCYQQWMKLVQRLHDRTSSSSSITKTYREKISPWYNDKLNSNKQVITLINHYSTMLSVDNHGQLISKFNDRPTSILKPMNKCRSTKGVTFAIN